MLLFNIKIDITFVALLICPKRHPKSFSMNWKFITPKFLVVTGLILFATLMRLLPHYPNFTPVAAIALFAGAHLGRRWLAYMIPMVVLLISDLFLGFHQMMIPVYLGFALIVLLGSLMHQRVRAQYVIGGSLAGSLLFFLITNFGVWALTPYYPNTFQGLITSYTMAIPFFHSSLLGDLFYNGLLFGSFYLITQRYPALSELRSPRAS